MSMVIGILQQIIRVTLLLVKKTSYGGSLDEEGEEPSQTYDGRMSVPDTIYGPVNSRGGDGILILVV